MKRFADFNTDTKPLDGEKMKIEEILNVEVNVIGYSIRKSKRQMPGSAGGSCRRTPNGFYRI